MKDKTWTKASIQTVLNGEPITNEIAVSLRCMGYSASEIQREIERTRPKRLSVNTVPDNTNNNGDSI